MERKADPDQAPALPARVHPGLEPGTSRPGQCAAGHGDTRQHSLRGPPLVSVGTISGRREGRHYSVQGVPLVIASPATYQCGTRQFVDPRVLLRQNDLFRDPAGLGVSGILCVELVDEACGRCGKPRCVRFSKSRWMRSWRPRRRQRPCAVPFYVRALVNRSPYRMAN